MLDLKLLCLIFILCIFPLVKAHAYFDPGTGSLIIQAIIAFIAGTTLFFKNLWLGLHLKLMSFFSKFIKKNDKKNEKTDG